MLWLLLLGLCAAVSAERKSYAGYKLFHVSPKTIEDVNYLSNMQASYEYDFWTEPRGTGRQTDVFVTPAAVKTFADQLSARGIPFVVDKMDVQSQIAQQFKKLDSRPENAVFNISDWNTLADIYAWVDALPTSCKAGVTCQTYTIGQSFEGRDIKAFKVSKAGSGRRVYMIDATHHCREWLSTGTVLRIMDHLVMQYGVDPVVTRLVDEYDWLIIPMVNPDGYEFTWTNERLWRKNRSTLHHNQPACYGVDLNRNYDFRHGGDGVSHDPCSDLYCGPSGNSEPEAVAVAGEYARHQTTARAMLTIHSYGNMWMWPWGNTLDGPSQTCERCDDHQDQVDIGDPSANAIEATHGTSWLRGNSCEVIYATTGGTDDYTKGALGVKYAFCLELRGNGFVLPPDQILPSFQEVWNGIVAMDDALTTKHGPSGP